MNKRFTEKAAAAVCRKLLKSTAGNGRDITHYPWTDAAGHQCFCDGYRLYRLRAALPDMPELPEDLTPPDLSGRFKALDNGAVVEIPAPDADAVKAFIRDRYSSKVPYDLGEDMPAANPDYILDLLRLFPGAAWYVQESPAARMCGPIYIVHDAGSALLMPCMKGPRTTQKPATGAPARQACRAGRGERTTTDEAGQPAGRANLRGSFDELTPEQFAELAEQSALSPEQFAALAAA